MKIFKREGARVCSALGLCAFVGACAATVPMNDSYRAIDKVAVENGSTLVLDTGETFDVDALLKAEGVTPKEFIVHKMYGVYIVAANGFKKLYFLTSSPPDSASVDSYHSDDMADGLKDVAIKAGVASRCATVSFTGKSGAQKLYVGKKAKVSAESCPEGASDSASK